MTKRPNLTKTTYSGALTGTSQWGDYASAETLSVEDVRKGFKAIEETDKMHREAESKHWNREGLREAYSEVSNAITYYLDKGNTRASNILALCRISMEYMGYPVPKTIAEEGRKLLEEYRLTVNKKLLDM